MLFLLDSLPGKPLPTYLSRLQTSVTSQWNSFSSCCLLFTILHYLCCYQFLCITGSGICLLVSLLRENFDHFFFLFSQGFLNNTGKDFLWSIITPLGTRAQPHTLEHSKGKSMWGTIEWKLSPRLGQRLTAGCPLDKVLAAQEGKFSIDAVVSGGNCYHYLGSMQCFAGLVVWGWKFNFHSSPGCLRHVMVALCWNYFSVCMALMDLALSSVSHVPLCSHLHPFYLSSLLIKRESLSFKQCFIHYRSSLCPQGLNHWKQSCEEGRLLFSSLLFHPIMLLSWVICPTQGRSCSVGWWEGEKCSVWKKKVGYYDKI